MIKIDSQTWAGINSIVLFALKLLKTLKNAAGAGIYFAMFVLQVGNKKVKNVLIDVLKLIKYHHVQKLFLECIITLMLIVCIMKNAKKL